MNGVQGRWAAAVSYDDTADVLAESEVLRQFAKSMSNDDQKRIKYNAPIAKYDPKTRRVYMEYPNGRKEYCHGSKI